MNCVLLWSGDACQTRATLFFFGLRFSALVSSSVGAYHFALNVDHCTG